MFCDMKKTCIYKKDQVILMLLSLQHHIKKPNLFHLSFTEWTVSVIVANVFFEEITELLLQDQR